MQPQRIINKPKRLTQKILILNALKDGSVLSQLDVYQEPYRCTRLAAVVNVLRNEGYNIITKTMKTKGSGKSYAQYRLIP
jgi:hypothetical protein